MNVISWEDFIEGALNEIGPIAASIGVFDGVHEGHRDLLSRIIDRNSTNSLVITFTTNPKKIFGRNSYPGDISTLSQKLSIFSSLGIDTVILIDFSGNFSNISGKDFLYLIKNSCDLSYLILGNNFRCGYKGMTTSEDALKIFKEEKAVVKIGSMTSLNDELISSTRIREAVESGNLLKARNMLKRVYSLDIADIPQISREQTIIINKEHIKQVLPPQGQYSVLTGTSEYTIKSKAILDSTEIIVPVKETGHLNFIKFTDK
ncbi:MAG: FAD synthetase family protein [Spirochaetales bacterium]|nr:FAD synthetase family protein [Spirochaetales bacterium]